jgi:hypothetical protein
MRLFLLCLAAAAAPSAVVLSQQQEGAPQQSAATEDQFRHLHDREGGAPWAQEFAFSDAAFAQFFDQVRPSCFNNGGPSAVRQRANGPVRLRVAPSISNTTCSLHPLRLSHGR